MCMSSTPWGKCNPIHIPRLIRRWLLEQAKEEVRRKKMKTMMNENQMEMIFDNLELYLENQNIMQENDKLRERAALLTKENKTLSLQLRHSQNYLPS